MADFCLPPDQVDLFKRELLSGRINPQTLAAMTSAKRREFFASHFGDTLAAKMNLELEKGLLRKNQQAGMVAWAKKMMAHDVTQRDDMVSRISKLKKYLEPADETAFMADLVAQKLGIAVSHGEAQEIADMVQAVEDANAAFDDGTGDRMDYGRAVVDLRNHVAKLKHQSQQLTMADVKRNPIAAAGKAIHIGFDTSKSILASMDNSSILRQGLRVLFTHPRVWRKNAQKTWGDLIRAFGSDAVINEVDADIISRPTYNLMRRARLAVGTEEEMFPSSLPEKIPVLGKAYRSTEHTYAAFQRKTRADVFDKYIASARRAGVDVNNQSVLEGIGNLVNALTGRSDLGPLEKVSGLMNMVFFAPRMVKSHVDTLLLHPLGRGVGGWGDLQPASFAQKQAAINLVKIIMHIAVVMAIVRALKPDSIEWNPLSSDFGTIKINNTRYDITGGMRSLVTLAARLLTNTSKRAGDDHSYPLTYRHNRGDVIMDFTRNKLSPWAGVAADIFWYGETRDREKPTIANEWQKVTVPIPAQTVQKSMDDPNVVNRIVAFMADFVGVSSNTYGPK